MTKHDKDETQAQDIIEEMQQEIEEIEDESGEINEEKLEEAQGTPDRKESSALEQLAKVQADFENFKKRTERDQDEMNFFLKSKILKTVLPRLDDVERMLSNTPEDMRSGALYEAIVALEKTLKKDLAGLGVQPFVSVGEIAHPDKHDVMTQIPGKPENEIIEEFEKGYILDGRVLRHAKVVVGAGA